MQDIEALASRILLIGKGRILMDGTLDDIRRGGESIDETVASCISSMIFRRAAMKNIFLFPPAF